MKFLFGSLLVLTAIPTAAFAQTPVLQPATNETLPETYERAFFRNAPDFYRDRSLSRQLNFMFGIGSIIRNSYPENEYIRDAQLINTLYQDTLQQQVGSSPTLRTPDLPNPYSSSLFALPPLEAVEPAAEQTPPETEVDSPTDAPLENEVDVIPPELDVPPDLETIPIE